MTDHKKISINPVLLTLTIGIILSGCAETVVRSAGEFGTYSSGECNLRVYQTKSQAMEYGNIKELCVVTGSSAFSFDHSIEGAIRKNAKSVCECGATNAYVESRLRESEMGIKGVSYVTLVGFRYIEK
ncbi:MAG: hypothetical protein PHD37_11455 [Gallionellaceae bacterium]|nr:hypothetical protein [Gallionellaceae bacterium]